MFGFKSQANIGHVFTNGQGLSGVVITDKEYPQRVAFVLINRVLEEFSTYSKNEWMSASSVLKCDNLRKYLEQYQNPRDTDAISRVQNELDETKIILVAFFYIALIKIYSTKQSILYSKEASA